MPDRKHIENDNKESLTPPEARDWQAVYAEARRHNLAANLYHAIKPIAGSIAVPESLLQAMRHDYIVAAGRNVILFQHLSNLLRKFNQHDIPAVLLKGAHLAEEVYGNAALRSMTDIDLLVRQTDLMRVERLLLAKKAIPEDRNRVIGPDKKHFSYRLAENGPRLEIHWQLMIGGPRRIDYAETEPRLRPIAINSVPAMALCPEDLLLHLCLHSAEHLDSLHLRMLWDITMVLQKYQAELDWPALTARAARWGASRPAYVMLMLAHEWFGAPLQEKWVETLMPDEMDSNILPEIRSRFVNLTPSDNGPMLSVSMAQFWAAGGLKAKLTILKKYLFLSPEKMASLYGAPANSRRILPFYVVRLIDVCRRHAKIFRRLAFGGADVRSAASRVSNHTEATDALRNWLLLR